MDCRCRGAFPRAPRRRTPAPSSRLLRGAPHPALVVPPRARRRRRARRPPTRVVPLPHRGRRQRATATTKNMQATRGGRRRARWGQSTWPRRARGDDAGVDARRTTTRCTASHTMCSTLGHLPARTVDNLNDWLRLQSVDVNSQSESPQQESPFNFCPNVQDLESITRGFSTFRCTFCGV